MSYANGNYYLLGNDSSLYYIGTCYNNLPTNCESEYRPIKISDTVSVASFSMGNSNGQMVDYDGNVFIFGTNVAYENEELFSGLIKKRGITQDVKKITGGYGPLYYLGADSLVYGWAYHDNRRF